MSAAFGKKPKLVRFVYDELSLTERNLEDLLMILSLLAIDRERVLQIEFPGYNNPGEIRIAALNEGYYLGFSILPEDSDQTHPMILAAENLTREDVEEVLNGICGEGKNTEDIPIVTEKLKNVTAEVYSSVYCTSSSFFGCQ